jgi:hypothetical protein
VEEREVEDRIQFWKDRSERPPFGDDWFGVAVRDFQILIAALKSREEEIERWKRFADSCKELGNQNTTLQERISELEEAYRIAKKMWAKATEKQVEAEQANAALRELCKEAIRVFQEKGLISDAKWFERMYKKGALLKGEGGSDVSTRDDAQRMG